MSKVTFLQGTATECLEVSDVQLITPELAEMGPLSKMKDLMPDDWKAYVQFKVNHSLPVIAGPLQSGNFSGYHPRVIANSHGSALHQQMNLNHKVASYDPKNITEDRIVGAIIATHFPMGDWSKIPADKAGAPCMTCVASIFKQAKGVNRMMGQHMANREPWSVSIESVFPIDEAAIFFPNQQKVVQMLDLPNDVWTAAVRRQNGRNVYGKYKGEQMVVMPGGSSGRISYQGVGLTPHPAEVEAHIEEMRAQHMDLGDGMMALCAAAHPLAMFQRGVKWRTPQSWTIAKVEKVFDDGMAVLGTEKRKATMEDPILQVLTLGGLRLLRSLKSVTVS